MELTDPILQRFDILCVLQDIVDPVEDEKLATFVVDSHHRSHPIRDDNYLGERSLEDNADQENKLDRNGVIAVTETDGIRTIDQKILKKYISYAKTTVRPALHDVDREKVRIPRIEISVN